MGRIWASAFFFATTLSLLGTPLLRNLALRVGFIDRPGSHKSHANPVPYLGGVAIIGGALIGMLTGGEIATRIAVLALGACVLGALGILDDRRGLNPSIRLVVQVGSAVVALLAGVRIHATDVAVVDGLLTIVWIVGITNALNLLDNMDGLAGGVGAVTSLGIFALAALGGQEIIATLGAAMTGACLGFLAYNVRPASVFMGDAGSLFIGYILAIGALELDPALLPPVSFAVPVILLALPLLDTTTVVFARLRRGRSVAQGGRDHLSHRLVARGMSPGMAVTMLITVQFICAAVAVVFGRGVINSVQATVLAGVPLAGVVLATVRARVYEEPVIGLPVRWYVLGFAGLGAVVVLSSPAVVTLMAARTGLQDAASDARAALASVQQGDQTAAAASFDRAARGFEREQRRLDGGLTSLGLAVPGLASNLRAARTLTDIGSDLARTGSRVARVTSPDRLRVTGGQVPLEEIERIAPELDSGARSLRVARRRVRAVGGTYLVPPIRSAVDELSERLDGAARDANQAAQAARLVPAMLGGDGTRRYFLAVQNSAELRATGGFIGNWGELVAEGGRVRLERFGRIAELNLGALSDTGESFPAPADFLRRYGRFEFTTTWQNVNMSPDFPTVARVIGELYPKSGGREVDGVIAVDPHGLAALLELTGPVPVKGWPEPLSAANVVDVTLRDAYERYPDARRVDFLGDVANTAWRSLTTADLPEPASIAEVLGPATSEGHLLFYPFRTDEAAMLQGLGVTGNARPVRSDALALVTQNAAGNKVDYYLRRSVDLDVRLEPVVHAGGSDPNRAVVRTKLSVELRNGAPSTGRSAIAIGPYSEEFEPGENRSFVSVYTPHGFDAAQVDGVATGLESAMELDRWVYSKFVSVQAGDVGALELELSGIVRLGPGGWYALDLDHQATVIPDEVTARILVPSGWRIAETRGLRRDGDGRASTRMTMEGDATLWVRVERTGVPGLWDRLRGGR